MAKKKKTNKLIYSFMFCLSDVIVNIWVLTLKCISYFSFFAVIVLSKPVLMVMKLIQMNGNKVLSERKEKEWEGDRWEGTGWKRGVEEDEDEKKQESWAGTFKKRVPNSAGLD